jgi:hypothetical protein
MLRDGKFLGKIGGADLSTGGDITLRAENFWYQIIHRPIRLCSDLGGGEFGKTQYVGILRTVEVHIALEQSDKVSIVGMSSILRFAKQIIRKHDQHNDQ